MAPVAAKNDKQEWVASFSEVGNLRTFVTWRESAWVKGVAMLLAALSAIAVSLLLLYMARVVLSYPLYPLIGAVFAFAVAQGIGCTAGNVYVWGWLYALHHFAVFAPIESITAITQYSETAMLYFGAVGAGCWTRNLSEKVTFYQKERDIWSSVIGTVEKRQRRFLREVLASVTDSRLVLCDSESELPTALPFPPGETVLALKSAALSDVRARVRNIAK